MRHRSSAAVGVMLLMVKAAATAPVVVDRIEAIVGSRAIKSSDVERDIRLTAFLNGQRLDLGEAPRKASKERLIDQQVIRTEIASGGYARASDADADALRRQIGKD